MVYNSWRLMTASFCWETFLFFIHTTATELHYLFLTAAQWAFLSCGCAESRVPDQPSALRAKPTSTSIFVSWGPPRNLDIMIRGYTIGWGIGLPDVYTKVLNGKQRYYTIENLRELYSFSSFLWRCNVIQWCHKNCGILKCTALYSLP